MDKNNPMFELETSKNINPVVFEEHKLKYQQRSETTSGVLNLSLHIPCTWQAATIHSKPAGLEREGLPRPLVGTEHQDARTAMYSPVTQT
jgi:hypothetical protein